MSTLTGTQVLLLVVSETGLVYTFTTVKLQPIVTKPEGKNLIQACLNAPDPVPAESSNVSIPLFCYRGVKAYIDGGLPFFYCRMEDTTTIATRLHEWKRMRISE